MSLVEGLFVVAYRCARKKIPCLKRRCNYLIIATCPDWRNGRSIARSAWGRKAVADQGQWTSLPGCWIPGILSYTNGASEKHYQLHFVALFKSFAAELRKRGLDTSDDAHFGNVSGYMHVTDYIL